VTVGFVLAQISDPHIVERGIEMSPGLDTAPFLTAAVRHLMGLSSVPNLVLVTGDLVNDGGPDQYDHLRELLAPLTLPYCLVPGNHDDVDTMRAYFPRHAAGVGRPRGDEVIEGEVRVVVLDSSRRDEPAGELDDAQLAWLEAVLEADRSKPTVIALHHPPFRTGIDVMDVMGLSTRTAAAFEAIVSRHGQIERILAGHLHRSITARFGGTIAMTVPGTAHAVTLALHPDDPPAWNLEPPAVTLHTWVAGTGLVTHTQAIGDWPATTYG
jgi:3',5'-cyclic-AMP phosphodiesterase